MNSISASDYLTKEQHEIFASDINDRIEALKHLVREAQLDGTDPFIEDEEELAALVEFRDRVQVETGKPFDEAAIVPEDEFEDHARDWAYGIGDFEFLDAYVNWERFAEDLKGELYTAMDFGDDTVYVR